MAKVEKLLSDFKRRQKYLLEVLFISIDSTFGIQSVFRVTSISELVLDLEKEYL